MDGLLKAYPKRTNRGRLEFEEGNCGLTESDQTPSFTAAAGNSCS